ncbi:MAG: DUF177 domain-containing protein [Abditibacteriales bacterium]|nr:DUF177 domain-containing protein [Abditibacteriales bacterium]
MDLRDVLREAGASLVEAFDEEIAELGDAILTSPVRGEVRVVNSRRYVVVSGEVETTVQLLCSRCLRPFDYPVRAQLEAQCELRYFEDLLAGLPVPEDEETTSVFDLTSVDVEELIRQAVLLELPIQPLHALDCKGLCPGCGSDLNDEACVCAERAVDPRWSQLTVLLEHHQKREET